MSIFFVRVMLCYFYSMEHCDIYLCVVSSSLFDPAVFTTAARRVVGKGEMSECSKQVCTRPNRRLADEVNTTGKKDNAKQQTIN